MKMLFLPVLLLCLGFSQLHAQNFKAYEQLELKEASDFTRTRDRALTCADFILKTPLNSDDHNLTHAQNFLTRWMDNCPKHTLQLPEYSLDLAAEQPALQMVHRAALIKTTFEHPNAEQLTNTQKEIITLEAILEYATDETHHVDDNFLLKQLRKAYNRNDMMDFLKDLHEAYEMN